MKRTMNSEIISKFLQYLKEDEKSRATQEKYRHELLVFASKVGNEEVNKQVVVEYKETLLEKYAPTSVNSKLAPLNSFFAWMGWHDCRVKPVHIQKQPFAEKDRELTKEEYFRLVTAAKQKKSQRLYYLLETICSTGIRVSELRFITVQSVLTGRVCVRCKGKSRTILLTKKLCQLLKTYICKSRIHKGSVFVTRSGAPMDRSNIWAEMKALCNAAGVAAKKVFPHNLRHLFARTFYALEKDLDCLAALLGHSSINTTRIYTMTTESNHMQQIERMNLLC